MTFTSKPRLPWPEYPLRVRGEFSRNLKGGWACAVCGAEIKVAVYYYDAKGAGRVHVTCGHAPA